VITETTLNPFTEAVKDLFGEGLSLVEMEESTPGGFTSDDLKDLRDHLPDGLTPEEVEWIHRRLQPPPILEQIQDAAAESSERRAEFEAVDAAMLSLCAAAVSQGCSFTESPPRRARVGRYLPSGSRGVHAGSPNHSRYAVDDDRSGAPRPRLDADLQARNVRREACLRRA
jgi:hypothetical protein